MAWNDDLPIRPETPLEIVTPRGAGTHIDDRNDLSEAGRQILRWKRVFHRECLIEKPECCKRNNCSLL